MYLHAPPTSLVSGYILREEPREGRKTRDTGTEIDTTSPEPPKSLMPQSGMSAEDVGSPIRQLAAIPIM